MRTRDQNALGFVPFRRTCRDAAPRQVATFERGHVAKANGDDLRIYNSSDEHVATFHGGLYTAADDDSGLHIFRSRRAATADAGRPHTSQLKSLNKINEEFWRPVR